MAGHALQEDPRCPRPDELRVIFATHRTFDGGTRIGELVVAREIAELTVSLLARLYTLRFPIWAMQPIERFGGSDEDSMIADNSSAFNFRTVAGTTRLSQHALGLAIDLNPRENPWIVGARIAPATGASYLDRHDVRLGMIVRPGPVVAAFDELGWEWGGDWLHARDYHHIVKKR